MNALKIIQEAAEALGFEMPKSIEPISDSNARCLLAHLNRVVEEIKISYDWQKMYRVCNFTADKQTAYNSNLKGYDINVIAPGFYNFITNFIYNNTQRKVLNSISLDQLAFAMMWNNSIIQKFVLQNDHITFHPELPLNTELTFFYKSSFPIIARDANRNITYKELFENDSDECVFRPELLIRGIIWKFKDDKGFDYAEAFRTYQIALQSAQDEDSNARNIIEGNNQGVGHPVGRVPDTGVGL